MTITRGPDGRFLPGNPGGPGRPRREVEELYLTTMHDRVSQEDWAEITDKAIQDAKDGDWRARDWLSSHLVRKAPLTMAVEEKQDNPIALGIVAGLQRMVELKEQRKEDEELPSSPEPARLPAGGS